MRRRLERMPLRLPRVGERPAGAERGDDFAIDVLSLDDGDLAWRTARRGEVMALRGAVRASLTGVGAEALGVRT